MQMRRTTMRPVDFVTVTKRTTKKDTLDIYSSDGDTIESHDLSYDSEYDIDFGDERSIESASFFDGLSSPPRPLPGASHVVFSFFLFRSTITLPHFSFR